MDTSLCLPSSPSPSPRLPEPDLSSLLCRTAFISFFLSSLPLTLPSCVKKSEAPADRCPLKLKFAKEKLIFSTSKLLKELYYSGVLFVVVKSENWSLNRRDGGENLSKTNLQRTMAYSAFLFICQSKLLLYLKHHHSQYLEPKIQHGNDVCRLIYNSYRYNQRFSRSFHCCSRLWRTWNRGNRLLFYSLTLFWNKTILLCSYDQKAFIPGNVQTTTVESLVGC